MVARLGGLPGGRNAQRGLKELLERLGMFNLQVRVVHQYHPEEFSRRFGADVAKLRDFWTNCLGNVDTAAWARAHPFIRGKSVG